MSISGSFSATSATRKLSFDPLDALVPVVEIGYAPNVLVVHPSLPSKSTKELISLARAHKGQLTFGLTNLGPHSVKLQMGARFCNVVFYAIEGEVIGYRGQHQGGRFSHGEEQQV